MDRELNEAFVSGKAEPPVAGRECLKRVGPHSDWWPQTASALMDAKHSRWSSQTNFPRPMCMRQ